MFSGIQHGSILMNSLVNSSQDSFKFRSTNTWSRELICSFWARVLFCECYNFLCCTLHDWYFIQQSTEMKNNPRGVYMHCPLSIRHVLFCPLHRLTWDAAGRTCSAKRPPTDTSEQLQTTPASAEHRWGQCSTFCPALSTRRAMHLDHLHRARGRKTCTSEEIQDQAQGG